jgi:hypothetical protein
MEICHFWISIFKDNKKLARGFQKKVPGRIPGPLSPRKKPIVDLKKKKVGPPRLRESGR